MLIETHAGGEREIRANPHEHRSPVAILDVEVILVDPTLLHFQVPVLVLSNGGHKTCRFSGFDDGHDLIRPRLAKPGSEEVVAPVFRIFLDFDLPLLRSLLDPVLVLLGNVAQHFAADRVDAAVDPEEPDDPCPLEERLDDGIQ